MAAVLATPGHIAMRGSQVGNEDMALIDEILSERSMFSAKSMGKMDSVTSPSPLDLTDSSSADDTPRSQLTHPTLNMLQSSSMSSFDSTRGGTTQDAPLVIPELEIESESSVEPVPKFLIRKGWIEKCGHTFKTWKWRYFELTRDGCLRYYTSEDKSVCKGMIHVEKTTKNDIVIQTHMSSREFFFVLSTPSRNYLFSTSTERTMKRWIRALESTGAHAGPGRWDPLRNTVHLTVDDDNKAHKWKGYEDPQDEQALMAGYLLKRGHVRTNWVQRFFRIEMADNHPMLRYYDDDRVTAKGSISLVNAYLSPGAPFSPDGRRNYFMLYCGTHELHLNALSEGDMRRWVHALAKAIVYRVHNPSAPPLPIQAAAAQATKIALGLPRVEIEFPSKESFETVLMERRSEALVVSQVSSLFPTLPLGAQLIRVNGTSIGLTLDAARLQLAQSAYPMVCEFICAPTKRGEMIKRSRSPRTLTSWKIREIVVEHGTLSILAWHEVRDSFSLTGCYLQILDIPGHPFCIAIGRSPAPADKLVLQASSLEDQMVWAATIHCSILMASQGLNVSGFDSHQLFFV
ncbi:unnamed protein product [Aphanomyces euteiches]|uniref:PH domain-containing protein n=1 Tax=Aphanomyces euteiches TaxID=100861 RepID=A0A6G0X5K1_9STRA|nr:hypothetical protein Ae201684_008297 [Aphanomyces euteiches]KAH9135691.1 hypothetical protein AeRB84_018951 [Aphanomyces euteiches]